MLLGAVVAGVKVLSVPPFNVSVVPPARADKLPGKGSECSRRGNGAAGRLTATPPVTVRLPV